MTNIEHVFEKVIRKQLLGPFFQDTVYLLWVLGIRVTRNYADECQYCQWYSKGELHLQTTLADDLGWQRLLLTRYASFYPIGPLGATNRSALVMLLAPILARPAA
jgi:hypothetical protein